MLRREVIKMGGGLFGLGKPMPSRFPYATRPQPAPAVGPSSATVVRANRVIVTGPSGGIYVYSGPPASGNLIESIGIAVAGFDPFHLNATLQGDTRYHNNGVTFVAQNSSFSIAAGLWQATSALGPYVNTNIQVAFAGDLTATPILQVQGPTVQLIGLGSATQLFVYPTGDTTGAADFAAITFALTRATSATVLAPGTYYVKAPLTVPAGNYLDLGGATIQPGSAWTTPPPVAMFTVNSGATLKNGAPYGGTNTRSANPAMDAITLAAGATQVTIRDITCNYMNGWILNATVTASAHCSVRGITGTNNAGGIQLTAAAGISAQYNIGDVNIQRCEVTEALLLDNVFDVLVSQFNASVNGSAGVPTVHLLGKVTTCFLSQMDCGVIAPATAGIPVLHVEDSGGSSVTDCRFSDSTYQAGGIGAAIDGGTARCQFSSVAVRNNAGDGFQFNGTGTALSVVGCYGNGNAGAADVNVTSTAHVGLDQFAYCSGGVTNSLAVIAGNHVSNNNPTSPGGKAVSGAPAGW